MNRLPLRWRANHWWFVPADPGQLPHDRDREPWETRYLPDSLLEMRQPETRLLQQLLSAHGRPRRVVFHAGAAVRDHLRRIGRRELHKVRDRQLLALLLDHAAEMRDVYGGHFQFGPGTTEPTAKIHDRYGVGPFRPLLWVLGEQANPRAATFPLPFGTAAGQAMIWPVLDLEHTRLSNGMEPNEAPDTASDTTRLAADWEGLGRPPILTIGSLASLRVFSNPALRSAHVGGLEHAQYVWRFHHDSVAGWIEQFRAFQHQALEVTGA